MYSLRVPSMRVLSQTLNQTQLFSEVGILCSCSGKLRVFTTPPQWSGLKQPNPTALS